MCGLGASLFSTVNCCAIQSSKKLNRMQQLQSVGGRWTDGWMHGGTAGPKCTELLCLIYALITCKRLRSRNDFAINFVVPTFIFIYLNPPTPPPTHGFVIEY